MRERQHAERDVKRQTQRHARGRGMRSTFTLVVAAATALSLMVSPAALAQSDETDSAMNAMRPDAPPDVTVTQQGTVQMHVAGLPLSAVLHALSLESQQNIIASPSVTGTVTASLYNATFEEALNAILLSNGAGYIRDGKFIYVYTNDELERLKKGSNPPITRVFKLSYLSAADAERYITPMLGEGGTISVSPPPTTGIGGDAEEGGSNTDAANDFVIVTDRPDKLRKIEKLLKELDVRPDQVLIEATIVRARLESQNALGIDFTVLGGVNFQMLDGASNAFTDLALGDVPTAELDDLNGRVSTDFAGSVPDGGLSIGIIKDQVAAFVRALETVTDTSVLANPKVLVLNKQRGEVIVGSRDGYLTTTVTETQAIQSVEFLETGTRLIFRPFIGDDGFVRVELHPEDSTGTVNAQGLPSEQTTEVTTNVIVRDGNTVLIGGLFREVTTDATAQVPGLGSIPGVGQLFRNNDNQTIREEVIVLMTIHVVKNHERYAARSAQQMEDIERMRVGQRSGLLWFGRERLAQAHYQEAVEQYAEGHDGLALWWARLAMHNNSRFLPAIKLKEAIEQKRPWDEDGTSARGFVYDIIQRDRGLISARFGRQLRPPLRDSDLRGPNDFQHDQDAPAGE